MSISNTGRMLSGLAMAYLLVLGVSVSQARSEGADADNVSAGRSSQAIEPETEGPLMHPGGLVVPEEVRKYWETHTPERDYNVLTFPPSMDWSANDSPVKDQGHICGSCWAFAAVALVENLGDKSDLSEQVVVSCVVTSPGFCDGGWHGDAVRYIRDCGIPPEECYPYSETDGVCEDKCEEPTFLEKVTSCTAGNGLWGENQTVDDLKSHLQTGPLCVSMRVPGDGTFDAYQGGVYNYEGGFIPWDQHAHSVLLVGYDDSQQCFKVKNSWGVGWGEGGYFRIAYDDVADDVRFGGYGFRAFGASEDDDITGPTFSYFSPTSVAEGTQFKIRCDMNDPSGVYDDGTGGSGQGVYLLWDNDGELTNTSYQGLMSSVGGSSTYETDFAIPSQDAGAPFVYEVFAYDNDFDSDNPADRTQGRSGVRSVQIEALDDDVTGPTFSSFFPTLATAGTQFKISCNITDPSGVYDDGTGSNGQGVYLKWDDDGELAASSHEALMSWKNSNTYETDNLIPAQTQGAPFVYEVLAYDNDFDNNDPTDRTQGRSGVRSIQVGTSQNGLLAIEIVPVYPSGYPFKPGEKAEFHFYVRDPANGNALIDTDTQTLYWSPDGIYVWPIYHLGTGHYQFPPLDKYALSTALYTWMFTVEKTGYGLSSAAFSQAVGNVQGYDPVQVQSLTVDPNDFWPGLQNVSVIYSVSKSCVGDLRVRHLPDSSLVRNLLTDYSFPAGADTILWDGRDEGGAYVDSNDTFFLELDVRALESWTNLGIFGPELKDPTGMKFRNNGWLYVTDGKYPTRCCVTVYDENRSFRKQIGTCGTGSGQFSAVQDLAFDNAGVYYYVYDPAFNGRIQKFTVSSDAVVELGRNYNVGYPAALAFGAPGVLYLGGFGGVWQIDQSNGAATRVVNLSSGVATTGVNLTPGQVTGLAVDAKGRIYCGVLNSSVIRVYSSSGQFLTSFTFINDGHDWALDIRSGRWLYARAELSIRVYDTEDLAAGPIESFNSYDSSDMGIAVNDVGNVVTTVDDNYEGRWLRDLSSFAIQCVAFTSGDCAGVGAGELDREPILGTPIPQPARGSLDVSYSLGVAGPARLVLYDVAGREISRLVDGNAGAGTTSLRILLVDANGRGLSAGIYFLRLEAQGRAITRKVILVK